MRRSLTLLALALAGSCTSIDDFLEADIPPNARLSVALPATPLIIPQGGEQSFTVTVTCTGECASPPDVRVDDAPAGVSLETVVAPPSGPAVSATITVHVSSAVPVGDYSLKIRGTAPKITEVSRVINLSVTVPPSFALATSRPAITIARGGVAKMTTTITRANFQAAVALSLSGASGITATFTPSASASDVFDVVVSVASDAASGNHAASVIASATAFADRVAPLTVTVTADPIQILADSAVSSPQAASVTANLIVNHGSFAGSVALEAGSLPAGTTATFTTSAASPFATVTFNVGATAPGTYPVTISGKGSGVPDGVATVVLNVTPASIAISLSAISVQLPAGTNTSATLNIARDAFGGVVAVTTEGPAVGVTITPSPASATGSSSTLTVTATPDAVVGNHIFTIRATPAGLPAGVQTIALTVTVRPPLSAGDVLLDWSGCSVPQWVAVQDGNGPWTRLTATDSRIHFTLSSTVAGIAIADPNTEASVSVVYVSRGELVGLPLAMCVPAPGTRSVAASAQQVSVTSAAIFRLGGGAGSAAGNTDFTIAGIREGMHDLIGWGVSTSGVTRGFLRRDVNPPEGGSLGALNIIGPESFTAFTRTLTIQGGLLAGETQLSYAMSYLTTSNCTVNALFTAAAGNTTNALGVPEAVQRSDDYHLLTASAVSPTRIRSVTTAFHTMNARTVVLPTAITTPAISAVDGPYKRLRAVIPAFPVAYNKSVELQYNDSRRIMRVTATVPYAGINGFTLTMPDLSGVAGWPTELAIAAAATGAWAVTVDGATSPGPLCSEERRTILTRMNGFF